MKTITVTVDRKTGRVTIETSGYEGATCLEATRKLEEGLGIIEPEREMLAEENIVETQQQVGGS